MLQFIILIAISILILNIWLWLFDKLFFFEKKISTIFLITISMWLISALSILFYWNFLEYIDYSHLQFTTQENIESLSVFFSFWIYLSIIVLIIKLIINKLNLSKFFLINYAIFSLLYFLLSYIWLEYITQVIFLYYIFVAFGEELMKFLIWSSFFEKWKITTNDLILFSILSAIGFAFVENIAYLIWSISWQEFTKAIIWWTSLLIARGLIGFLAHIIFTWNIWYFVTKWIKNNILKYSLIWIILWTTMHLLYNLWLANNFWVVIPIIIIFWYFWISYLFFNSDRLFIKSSI